MAYSTQQVVSDGTLANLALSVVYFDRAEIAVSFNGVDVPSSSGLWAWVGTTDKTIHFTPNVSAGTVVLIRRKTDVAASRHVFNTGAQFLEQTLDENFAQILRVAQEVQEGGTVKEVFNDLNMHGFKVKNVGNAVDPQDAVTLSQYQSDVAGVYAARVAAEAAYDAFDDRYLGAKATDPSVDNDGNALITGALYFNTTSNSMRIYTATAWAPIAASASNVTVTPVGGVAATNVQAAIQELDAEKVAAAALSASTGSASMGHSRTGTGAVPATVKAEFDRLVVNVEQFGAMAGQNSHQAFMDAVNYIAARSSQGGELVVPNRSSPFLIGELIVPAMYRLKLQGEGNSKIKLLDGANASMFTPNQNTLLILEDLYLDGNKANQTGGTSHIVNLVQATGTTYAYGAHLKDCLLLRARNDNLHVENYRSNGRMNNVVMEAAGNNALYLQAVDWNVLACGMGNSGASNLYLDQGSNKFVACDWYGAGTHGIEMTGRATGVSFHGQIDRNALHGVSIGADVGAGVSRSVIFEGVKFNYNSQSGAGLGSDIYVNGASGVQVIGGNFGNPYGEALNVKHFVEAVGTLTQPVMVLGTGYIGSPTVSPINDPAKVVEISPRRFRINAKSIANNINFLGDAVTDPIFYFTVTGDPQARFYIRADGSQIFGDGTNSQDTTWARRGANLIGPGADDSLLIDNGGFLQLKKPDGSVVYLWPDDSGKLRISTTVPSARNTDGTVVGTQT